MWFEISLIEAVVLQLFHVGLFGADRDFAIVSVVFDVEVRKIFEKYESESR